MCVCVCVCLCVCVCAYMRACVRACVRVTTWLHDEDIQLCKMEMIIQSAFVHIRLAKFGQTSSQDEF